MKSKPAFRQSTGLYPIRNLITRLRAQKPVCRGGPGCTTMYDVQVAHLRVKVTADQVLFNLGHGVRGSRHAVKSSNIHAGIVHCHSHLLLKTCWAIGTRCTRTLRNHRTCRRRTSCCNPKVGSTSRSRIWRPSMESTLAIREDISTPLRQGRTLNSRLLQLT